MERTKGGSVRKARIRICPPQFGHSSGSTSRPTLRVGAVGLRALGGFALVVRDRRAILGLAFAQGDHVGPKPGIRGQHSVIAMAVDARWRNQA